jgi:hypothetical protein
MYTFDDRGGDSVTLRPEATAGIVRACISNGLLHNQRQKVWATKVPRFGEIWWFYPKGDSEECNDAIIYNIREN